MVDKLLDSRQLLWIIGILLVVIGSMVGHITTREAIANGLRDNFVPRTEIELQLEIINEKLDVLILKG